MRSLLVLTLVVAAVVENGRAEATTILDLSGPELVALSDAVVHARVLKVRGHVTGQSRVFTDAELEVIEGFKGVAAGARLKVSYPGGVWNGLGMQVSGQVALKENSECLIYLQKSSDVYMPTAMREGYFEIKPRPYDGVRIAYRSTAGLSLVRHAPQAPNGLVLEDRAREFNTPLVQLAGDIRQDVVEARTLSRQRILGVAR